MAKPKAKKGLSLSALAKELNAEPTEIARICEKRGVKPDDWVRCDTGMSDLDANLGKRIWQGRVSAGLAETIRDWHRRGLLAPKPTAAERRKRLDQALIEYAVGDAYRNSSCTVLSSIDGIVLTLRKLGVETTKSRGRTLAWKAWCYLVDSGLDFERWTECSTCQVSFVPSVTRQFMDTYIDMHSKTPSRWRAREREILRCEDCRRSKRAGSAAKSKA